MRGMAIVKTTRDTEKRSSPAPWTKKMQATVRHAVKSVVCAVFACLGMTSAAVADPPALYSSMAPIDAYLMDRTQEVVLARSAAPDSISKHATILVLTRAGYETAVTGTNGFVCWVGRGFVGASDAPERWNPKIRAADCENPPAARSVIPIVKLRTAMTLAGRTTSETLNRIRTALSTKAIPPLESGAMSYMMSKSSYLTDQGDHDMPHLMFFVAVKDVADWGANAPDTPIIGVNYWFFMPGHEAETASLPPLCVFITGVATWSDGTPATTHRM